ncbi:unnamed protein product [Parajaminaea phylloscopi]
MADPNAPFDLYAILVPVPSRAVRRYVPRTDEARGPLRVLIIPLRRRPPELRGTPHTEDPFAHAFELTLQRSTNRAGGSPVFSADDEATDPSPASDDGSGPSSDGTATPNDGTATPRASEYVQGQPVYGDPAATASQNELGPMWARPLFEALPSVRGEEESAEDMFQYIWTTPPTPVPESEQNQEPPGASEESVADPPASEVPPTNPGISPSEAYPFLFGPDISPPNASPFDPGAPPPEPISSSRPLSLEPESTSSRQQTPLSEPRTRSDSAESQGIEVDTPTPEPVPQDVPSEPPTPQSEGTSTLDPTAPAFEPRSHDVEPPASSTDSAPESPQEEEQTPTTQPNAEQAGGLSFEFNFNEVGFEAQLRPLASQPDFDWWQTQWQPLTSQTDFSGRPTEPQTTSMPPELACVQAVANLFELEPLALALGSSLPEMEAMAASTEPGTPETATESHATHSPPLSSPPAPPLAEAERHTSPPNPASPPQQPEASVVGLQPADSDLDEGTIENQPATDWLPQVATPEPSRFDPRAPPFEPSSSASDSLFEPEAEPALFEPDALQHSAEVPDFFTTPPQAETVPPQFGQIFPIPGAVPPQLAYTHPQFGLRRLHRGVVNQLRLMNPHFRIAMDHFGVAMPQSGAARPQFGAAIPQFGSVFPQFGSALPQFGATMVPQPGSALPQFEADLPGVERNISDSVEDAPQLVTEPSQMATEVHHFEPDIPQFEPDVHGFEPDVPRFEELPQFEPELDTEMLDIGFQPVDPEPPISHLEPAPPPAPQVAPDYEPGLFAAGFQARSYEPQSTQLHSQTPAAEAYLPQYVTQPSQVPTAGSSRRTLGESLGIRPRLPRDVADVDMSRPSSSMTSRSVESASTEDQEMEAHLPQYVTHPSQAPTAGSSRRTLGESLGIRPRLPHDVADVEMSRPSSSMTSRSVESASAEDREMVVLGRNNQPAQQSGSGSSDMGGQHQQEEEAGQGLRELASRNATVSRVESPHNPGRVHHSTRKTQGVPVPGFREVFLQQPGAQPDLRPPPLQRNVAWVAADRHSENGKCGIGVAFYYESRELNLSEHIVGETIHTRAALVGVLRALHRAGDRMLLIIMPWVWIRRLFSEQIPRWKRSNWQDIEPEWLFIVDLARMVDTEVTRKNWETGIILQTRNSDAVGGRHRIAKRLAREACLGQGDMWFGALPDAGTNPPS